MFQHDREGSKQDNPVAYLWARTSGLTLPGNESIPKVKFILMEKFYSVFTWGGFGSKIIQCFSNQCKLFWLPSAHSMNAQYVEHLSCTNLCPTTPCFVSVMLWLPIAFLEQRLYSTLYDCNELSEKDKIHQDSRVLPCRQGKKKEEMKDFHLWLIWNN